MTALYTLDLWMRSIALVDGNGNLLPSVVPFGITLLTFFYGLVERLLACCYKKKEIVTVSIFTFFKREFPLGAEEEEEERDHESKSSKSNVPTGNLKRNKEGEIVEEYEDEEATWRDEGVAEKNL